MLLLLAATETTNNLASLLAKFHESNFIELFCMCVCLNKKKKKTKILNRIVLLMIAVSASIYEYLPQYHLRC